MAQRFGKDVRVKFVGGELVVRLPFDSLNAYAEKLMGVKAKALDLREPFEAFRPIWQQQTRDVFDAEGLPLTWPALSPAYSARKAIEFPGQPIMQRTGRLAESLIGETSDSIWAVTQRTIKYGTKVPYFEWHQRGTDVLPVRQTLVMLPETFAALQDLVMKHVLGPLTGPSNG